MNQVPLFLLAMTALGFLGGCQAPPRESHPQALAMSDTGPSAEGPGLATAWGETLHSPVSSTEFQRGSQQPAAVTKVFYNNVTGIEQLTSDRAQRTSGHTIALDGIATIRIETPQGKAYPVWRWRGDPYVEGRQGQRYVIEVANVCSAPIEVVVSVDGLDAIDGQSASFSKRGYRIAPERTVRIAGFRRSTEAVAAFRFSSVAESYAQQKHGDARHVGIIGVAAFLERGSHPDLRLRQTADPFPDETRFATPP